jgi:hypothetical protein
LGHLYRSVLCAGLPGFAIDADDILPRVFPFKKENYIESTPAYPQSTTKPIAINTQPADF